ncbi:MAG: hypothetical protein JWR23_408 [Mucilaginibacter sp.]|nr:hypothetical protein [Mucilaginibacter sp.]
MAERTPLTHPAALRARPSLRQAVKRVTRCRFVNFLKVDKSLDYLKNPLSAEGEERVDQRSVVGVSNRRLTIAPTFLPTFQNDPGRKSRNRLRLRAPRLLHRTKPLKCVALSMPRL